MQDLNGGETLQLQPRVQRAQSPEHVDVVAERQRWMQTPYDMQLGDPQAQRVTGLGGDFFHVELKTVRIALFSGEGAELAAQDAIIRVVDVAIDNIARAVPNLALAREVRNRAD